MSRKKFLLFPLLFLCIGCAASIFLCQAAFKVPLEFAQATPATGTPGATASPFSTTATPWPTATLWPTSTLWPTPTAYGENTELLGEPSSTPAALLMFPIMLCGEGCGTDAVLDYSLMSTDAQLQAVLSGLQKAGRNVEKADVTIERTGQLLIVFRVGNQEGYYLDPTGTIHENNSSDLLIFGLRLEERQPMQLEGKAVVVNDQVILIAPGLDACPETVVAIAESDQVMAVVLADNLSIEQTTGKIGLVTRRPVSACSMP
jgi:hypothetical protein